MLVEFIRVNLEGFAFIKFLPCPWIPPTTDVKFLCVSVLSVCGFPFPVGFYRCGVTSVTQHFIALDSVRNVEKLEERGGCAQLMSKLLTVLFKRPEHLSAYWGFQNPSAIAGYAMSEQRRHLVARVESDHTSSLMEHSRNRDSAAS